MKYLNHSIMSKTQTPPAFNRERLNAYLEEGNTPESNDAVNATVNSMTSAERHSVMDALLASFEEAQLPAMSEGTPVFVDGGMTAEEIGLILGLNEKAA